MIGKGVILCILLASISMNSLAFNLKGSNKLPELKDWVLGNYDPEAFSDFEHVPDDLTFHEPGKLYMLHKDSLAAFTRMQAEAQKDNISLKLISALRNFPYQKRLWENSYVKVKLANPKFNDDQIALQIMTYSAMPTTSRHHWGTDMDINSVEPEYFESGQGLLEYNWLKANAPKFGFCQPYSPKDDGSRTKGYNLEQWHWSYMPISFNLLNYYKNNVTYEDIKGFSASQDADKIHSIEDYVLSINSACLNWTPAHQNY